MTNYEKAVLAEFIYRELEELDGERGREIAIPYEEAETLKWDLLKLIV